MENNTNLNTNTPEKTAVSKRFRIQNVGGEKEINFFVVLEMFRFLFYLWFVLIMVTAILLTVIFTEEEYSAIIKTIFGSINVCVFFDFAPSIYVLPSLFTVWPIIAFQYSMFSIFRAWIAKEENKMSTFSFISYTLIFVYFNVSIVVFSTSLAIQPDLNKPTTIILHTLPFTNFIVALTFFQVAITWFGFRVSWKGLNIPKLLHIATYVCIIMMVITSIMKILQHFNAVLDLGDGLERDVSVHGIWWSVRNETMQRILQIVDAMWMISALFWPMCQSGYLLWRNFDTHGLIITIGDNRRANEKNSRNHEGIENEGIEMKE